MNSDRLIKLITWVLAVLIIGGTIFALRYVRGYRPLMGLGFLDAGGMPADIALRFDDVHVACRKDNRVAWTLRAGRVETNQAHSRLVFSHGINAVLMAVGKPRATVFSPDATYDTVQHVLDVTGKSICHVFGKGATASTSDDLTIKTQEVIWDTSQKTVLCRGPVIATESGDTIKGNDLSVNLQTRDWSAHQFDATFVLDDSHSTPIPDALKGLVQ